MTLTYTKRLSCVSRRWSRPALGSQRNRRPSCCGRCDQSTRSTLTLLSNHRSGLWPGKIGVQVSFTTGMGIKAVSFTEWVKFSLTARPSTTHWTEAGGLEFDVVHSNLRLSPTFASVGPLIVTLSGATEIVNSLNKFSGRKKKKFTLGEKTRRLTHRSLGRH